jgi:hypothetical protein
MEELAGAAWSPANTRHSKSTSLVLDHSDWWVIKIWKRNLRPSVSYGINWSGGLFQVKISLTCRTGCEEGSLAHWSNNPVLVALKCHWYNSYLMPLKGERLGDTRWICDGGNHAFIHKENKRIEQLHGGTLLMLCLWYLHTWACFFQTCTSWVDIA